MKSQLTVRQITDRLLRSDRLADMLSACLMASGTACGLFYLAGLETSPLSTFFLSLLPAVLLMLLARFWRIASVAVLMAALLAIVALLRLEYLGDVFDKVSYFIRWAVTWLQIGQPEPDQAIWLIWLRLLIISGLLVIWLPLVRRASWPLLHGGLLALLFTPLLIAFPAAFKGLLTALCGLLLLLPRSFIRRAGQSLPAAERLIRAPLQFLALPAIIISLLLAQGMVPENTRSWRWPYLVNQINDIGDLLESQSGRQRDWQPFNIGIYGFQTEGGRLGGPAVLSRQNVLRVTTSTPVLLRGTSLTTYTGSSWQRSSHQYYRFGSSFWRVLRQRAFGLQLPSGAAGRRFRSNYLQQVSLQVEPLTANMATVFTAERTLTISLADNIDYTPYFNLQGDIFIFGGLPRSYAYRVTAEIFDRNLTGFDEALLAIENEMARNQDVNWPIVTAEYLQLPDDLPAIVGQTAQSAVGQAVSPYAQAVALEDYFKKGFIYTLTPETSSRENDFVASFLEMREGYCVHYATAMVVMARTLGIPARYTEGFVLKPASDNTSGQKWLAAGNTAHAWAELYFAGIGWLTFDPTPGNSANDPENPIPSVTVAPSGLPSPVPSVSPTPLPKPDNSDDEDVYRSLYWLMLVLAILALAGLILLQLIRRRHRRLFDPAWIFSHYPLPQDRLEYYYQDLLRQLACLDIQPEPGETLMDFADRIEHRLRLEGLNAAVALASVGPWRYGSIHPGESDLKLIAALHQRLEERLLASLGRWTYFIERILKSWAV